MPELTTASSVVATVTAAAPTYAGTETIVSSFKEPSVGVLRDAQLPSVTLFSRVLRSSEIGSTMK